jgi:uncharacterized peroxidase-related enzyme
MTRVQPVTKDKASPEVAAIYSTIEKNLGKVPNIFQNMGNSAALLKGFLGLSEAAGHTSLDAKLREEIALIVAESNHCNYCLSAHSAMAHAAGIAQQEILDARHGKSSNPKKNAILAFAKVVVEKKGHVSDSDVAALKAAGIDDKEIVEIILVIMVNMFTNYFNHITDPKIDFPVAPKLT